MAALKLLCCLAFIAVYGKLVSGGLPITSLGCWKDTGTRAIPTLEGTDSRLDGNYLLRKDALRKCYEVAKSKGFKVFAVQHGGWCASSATAGQTYKKYGPSKDCKDGNGGGWANDVYQIGAPKPVAKPAAAYVQLNKKDCWGRCSHRGKGGKCPKFCGPTGFCCRKGWKDCPADMAVVSPKHHTCVVPSGVQAATSNTVVYKTYTTTKVYNTYKIVKGKGKRRGKGDEPQADEPQTDEPEADEPEADEPEADEPQADEPEADEPEADETEADEPEADEPQDDEQFENDEQVAEPEDH